MSTLNQTFVHPSCQTLISNQSLSASGNTVTTLLAINTATLGGVIYNSFLWVDPGADNTVTATLVAASAVPAANPNTPLSSAFMLAKLRVNNGSGAQTVNIYPVYVLPANWGIFLQIGMGSAAISSIYGQVSFLQNT